jgi:hypothetical protein
MGDFCETLCVQRQVILMGGSGAVNNCPQFEMDWNAEVSTGN